MTSTIHGQGTPTPLLNRVTLALGALFLVTTAYLTVQQMVTRTSRLAGGDALSVEALKQLLPGERAEAEQEAQSALARNTLNSGALLDLSRIAEANGETDAAERLKLIAGQLRPRVAAVQAEAMEILLRRRDFDSVMGRLDGLIRAKPAQARDFFAVAAAISAEADGSKAAARMLATNPPWRPQFFAYVIRDAAPGTAQRILSDMRAMNMPIGSSELVALIDSLLHKNDVDGAYAVWLSSLSEAELRDVRRVYDGDFSHPIRSLRFDWTVKPDAGLTFRLFPRNTASMDQTLQLDLRNYPGTFANLSQILRLKPGRYSLSGEARFEDFQSPAALVFRLYCIEGGKTRLLDDTATLPQSSQWIAFDKPLEVPGGGCPNQLLQLESETKLDAAQLTTGLVAIDAIKIDALPELAP